MTFSPSGGLILARMETEGQRVFRVRNLLAADPLAVIHEFTDFPRHVYSADLSPDGSRLAIDGLNNTGRRTTVFNLADGTSFDIPSQSTLDWGGVAFDPTGKSVVAVIENSERSVLVDSATGAFLGNYDAYPACLGVEGRRAAMRHRPSDDDDADEPGLEYLVRGEVDPLIKFRVELPTSVKARFSADGRYLAWGNPDGSVSLCDLPEVQRRLTALGLGWSEKP